MLIKTEIPSFVLKQEPSTPPNLMMGLKTIWEFISVPSRILCPTVEVANGNFCFLTERDWGQKSCYGNSNKGAILFLFLMHIYGAKLQEHCFNISRDIVYLNN